MDDQIEEYHFHVYFFQHNPASRDLAFQLRTDFSLFVEERLLVAALDNVHDGPVGPHPTGSYEIWVPAEYFEPALAWFLTHRPSSISILCHPLTRHELLDHTARAIWLGTPLGLDLSALSQELDRAPSRYQTLRLSYSKNNTDPAVADPIHPVLANNQNDQQSEKVFDELRDSMCSVCSDDENSQEAQNVVTATISSNNNQRDSVNHAIENNTPGLSRANEVIENRHEIPRASDPPVNNTDLTTDKMISKKNNNNTNSILLRIPDKPELIVADSNDRSADQGARKKKKKSKEKKQKKNKKPRSASVTVGTRTAPPIPVVNPYLVSTRQVKTALQTLTVFPSAAVPNTFIERPVHREPPPVPVPVIPTGLTSIFGYNSSLLNHATQVPQTVQQQSSIIRRNDISMLVNAQQQPAVPTTEFPAVFQSTEQTVDVHSINFQPEKNDAQPLVSNSINAPMQEEVLHKQAETNLLPHPVHTSDEHAAQHQPFPAETQVPLTILNVPNNSNTLRDASTVQQPSLAPHGAQVPDVIAAPTNLLEPRASASVTANSRILNSADQSTPSVPIATSASLRGAPENGGAQDHDRRPDLQPTIITSAGSGTAAPYHTGHKRRRSPSPSHNRKRRRVSNRENDISDRDSESDSDSNSSSSSVRIIGVNQVYCSTIDVEEIDARPVLDLRSEEKPILE